MGCKNLPAIGQSDFGEGGICGIVECLLAVCAPEKTETSLRARLHGEGNVFQCGESRQHRSNLERARKAKLCALVDWQSGDISAIELDSAGSWCEQTGNLVYQRGFSRAIRANYRVQFTVSDVERHTVGYDETAEVFVQVVQLQNGFTHGQTFREFY